MSTILSRFSPRAIASVVVASVASVASVACAVGVVACGDEETHNAPTPVCTAPCPNEPTFGAGGSGGSSSGGAGTTGPGGASAGDAGAGDAARPGADGGAGALDAPGGGDAVFDFAPADTGVTQPEANGFD